MCVYVRVCVCAQAAATDGHQQQWISISFLPTTEINSPPSFISKQCLGFRPKCALPFFSDPPPAPARVPREEEARIDALQAGFPLFFRCDRRIPGPPRPPTPAAAPFPVTIFPPSPLPSKAHGSGPAPPSRPAQVARAWRGNQTWRARRHGARVRAQTSLYREPAVFCFGDQCTSGAGGAREPEPADERSLLIGSYQKWAGRRRDLEEPEALPHWSKREGWGGAVSSLGCAFS